MIRTPLMAAAFAGLISATAFAQPAGPRLVDEANSPTIVYDAPSANIVGSANVSVSGNPNEVEYRTQRVYRTQSPAAGCAYGVGRDWQIEVDSSN